MKVKFIGERDVSYINHEVHPEPTKKTKIKQKRHKLNYSSVIRSSNKDSFNDDQFHQSFTKARVRKGAKQWQSIDFTEQRLELNSNSYIIVNLDKFK